jgi:hypothetical protein
VNYPEETKRRIGINSAVSKTVTDPRSFVGAPCKCRKSGYRAQRLSEARGTGDGYFLRRSVAPHLLVSLDSLVPTPLTDTRLKVRGDLSDVLALAHHAAAHLVAIGIDC